MVLNGAGSVKGGTGWYLVVQCPVSVWDDTGWHLVVLGKYNMVLLGIKFTGLVRGFSACIY